MAALMVIRPEIIDVYDLMHTRAADRSDARQAARAWDEIHAVATLQGIVNRDRPRLYLRYIEQDGLNIDDWWLAHLSRPGEWLHHIRRRRVPALEALVTQFRGFLQGAVVYDPHVPATSNVASALAGAEDLIAVRFDPSPGSVYSRLVAGGPRLPVRHWLVNPDGTPRFTGRGPLPDVHRPSCGSAKCDAYRWAAATLLDSGRCAADCLGYYLDSYWIAHASASAPDQHTLTNHDYFVARRAFFCDLHVWSDETPVDDPGQPLGTDFETFRSILRTLHRRNHGNMIHVGGFIPWCFKYTSFGDAGGDHGGVKTEWELVRLLSAYDAYLDADALGYAALANASFFQHFPLESHYPQAGPPTDAQLRARGYLAADGRVDTRRDYAMLYAGDYDSAAWLHRFTPVVWEDPRRGEVPLSWAISPALQQRAPAAMAHLWRTRQAQDAFVAGDNGAGYLNPSMLAEPRPISGLPSGLEAWTAHCARYYRRWDLAITGFVIDGNAPPMNDAALAAYTRFSPAGIVEQRCTPALRLLGETPIWRAGTFAPPDATPAEAADLLVRHVAAQRREGRPFHWFRTILKSPTWHAELAARVRAQVPTLEIVAAPVLFRLMRHYLAARLDRE